MPRGNKGEKKEKKEKREKKRTTKERIAALTEEASALRKMFAALPGYEEQKRREAERIAQLKMFGRLSSPFSGGCLSTCGMKGGTRRRTRKNRKSNKKRKTRRRR